MKNIRTALPLTLVLLLAACGGDGPTPTPPTETPPTTPAPPTTPTPPITPPPPPTDPVTPPVTPLPPVDPVDPVEPPADVPYGGTWIWVVVFEDDTTASGNLSITQVESEPAVYINSGEGPYYQCDGESCPTEPDGLSVIGTFIADDGSESLSTAFIDSDLSSVVRLIGIDADNQLGTEIQGQETFLGVGQWTEDDGSFANVTVAIARAPSTTSTDTFQAKLTQRLKAEQSDLEKVDRSRLRELR